MKETIKKLWESTKSFLSSLCTNPLFLLIVVIGAWLLSGYVWYQMEKDSPVLATVDGESVLLAFSEDGKWLEVYKDYILISKFQQCDGVFPDYLMAYQHNKKGLFDYLSNSNILIFLAACRT